jgi:hypothetical protein
MRNIGNALGLAVMVTCMPAGQRTGHKGNFPYAPTRIWVLIVTNDLGLDLSAGHSFDLFAIVDCQVRWQILDG